MSNGRRRRRLRTQRKAGARSPRVSTALAQSVVQHKAVEKQQRRDQQRRPAFLGPGSFEP